ncbi:DNA repair protein RecO [bacterium]|nr:MAG: DNA repair protein RecO [bacterium]
MPSYQTTGLVIGRTNFGESDRIIRFITPDYGKISAVARGVRKIKSRLAGHLEPLGTVMLSLTTGRSNIDVITGARLLYYPHQLAKNWQLLDPALTLAVLLERLLETGQPQAPAYLALKTLISELDAGSPPALVELWYRLQVASSLGYQPELSGCLLCGHDTADRQYHFDPHRGGLVCQYCALPGAADISTASIKLWRLMSHQPYQIVSHIVGAETLATLTLPHARQFFAEHVRAT